MVLPASAAHAAPAAAPWLDRLSRIFELGRGRGVMVLVRGGPERLGDVVRCVVGLSPDASVLVRAEELASLAPESTAVLCLRSKDFDWLNIARPVVLGHRIVLFGDAATALTLEKRAVDFCDWISHRIDAPPGPPPFAVRAIRDSACKRSPAVVWKGGDVEAAIAEALPGRILSRSSVALPYTKLVEALRAKPRTWALITDVSSAFHVRRMRWAMAEAARYGRTVLIEPGLEISGLPVAHGLPMSIEDAAAKLETAGLSRGARLAALLDLDPDAIARAATAASEGASEIDLEKKISELVQPRIPPLNAAERRLPDWPERVEMAVRHRDKEAAFHWASAWRAAEPANARATAMLAFVHVWWDEADEAQALLRLANEQAGSLEDAGTAFQIRRAEALHFASERRFDEALRALDDAIRLLRKSHHPAKQADELRLLQVRWLTNLGRLDDAERAVKDWPPPSPAEAEGNSLRSLAIALVTLARGDTATATTLLLPIFEHRREYESPLTGIVIQPLVQALLDRRAFHDAERLTRMAVAHAEQHGQPSSHFRHEHARALLGLGRLDEAEREFRRTLATIPAGRDAALTRKELARCLSAQGRFEEADTVLDEALAELAASPPGDPGSRLAMLYEKAFLHHLRGDHREAIRQFRDVLRAEELALGREHPTLIVTLTAIGDALIQNRDPAAAQPYLRRAQRLAMQRGDKLRAAIALAHLATAQAMQRFPQAADTARRALDAWLRSGEAPAPNVQARLEAIAASELAGVPTAPPRRLPPR